MTHFWEDPDGDRQLEVKVTDEGVILDAWEHDELIGTMGMTFEEWWEYTDYYTKRLIEAQREKT